MNFDKLDKIVLTQNDLINLMEWKEGNKELVRGFTPSLLEGVIIYGDFWKQYFKQDGFVTHIKIYINDIYAFSFDIKPAIEQQGFFVVHNEKFGDTDFSFPSRQIAIQESLTLYCSTMAYMQFNVEYVEREEVEKKKTKKINKKSPSNSKRVVKMKSVIYNVRVPQQSTNEERKKYERHVDSWMVRGHYRTTKTGKRVWVKPYKKGEGEISPKTYKMD